MLSAKEKIGQNVSTLAGCKNTLIGTQVVVELLEGEQYTGILKDFTDEFVITLSYAQKMPTSDESEFILCEGTAEKVLQLRNVVRISGSIGDKDQFKVFRTDCEISEMNGGTREKDQDLLPWNADGDMNYNDEDDLLPEVNVKGMRRACKGVWEDGWKAETMFEMNKDKLIGTSTFDESLSQYSNVEVQNCTEEQIKRAEQIAKAIESDIESKRNALLENDDEERNLNERTEFRTKNQRPNERFEFKAKNQRPNERYEFKTKNQRPIERTEFKTKSQRPAEKFQQNPMQVQQQKRPQRVPREGTDPRRVSGSTSMPAMGERVKEVKKEANGTEEQQKEKFKLNPAAAPFVPKAKDLNSNSTTATNTSPLMSNPITSFVQLPASAAALPTQGISTPNLVFYHQQAQPVVPAQIPTNTASYHQQPQNILPAQVPSNSMAYHQQPQTILPAQVPSNSMSYPQQPHTVLPAQISSNQVFYQQQSQSFIPAQLPSNPIYATYPVSNSGQSIVFVSPAAPHQAVILQPQHFIPVSAATFPSQNVGHHFRTVTPNGVNPQTPMPHHPTNICPPPLHPAAQGVIIQSPPALLNLTMPPNCVASAPPPSFHPTGLYQQQF